MADHKKENLFCKLSRSSFLKANTHAYELFKSDCYTKYTRTAISESVFQIVKSSYEFSHWISVHYQGLCIIYLYYKFYLFIYFMYMSFFLS